MAFIQVPLALSEMQCSLCNNYLCSPLQVLPDGTNICGRCTSGQGTSYRCFTLEAVLGRALFPCKFGQHGCKEQLSFNHTDEHEMKCNYRLSSCPTIPDGSCLWMGPLLEIPVHFTESHPTLVMKTIEVNLQTDQDKKEVLLAIVEETAFIVRYAYNAEASRLYYNVNHFGLHINNYSYKVQLTNGLGHEYSIILKDNENTFFGSNNNEQYKIFMINNFLENSNRLEYILLTLDITIPKVEVEALTYTENVDYNLLENLHCGECNDFLIPPLFDSKKGIICFDCSKIVHDCTPTKNKRLQEAVSKAKFPCRWPACKYTRKVTTIQKHEQYCQFRIYNCFTDTCDSTFMMTNAITHLKNHSCRYFVDRFIFYMNFSKPFESKIFTIYDKEIIYVTCTFESDEPESAFKYTLSLQSSSVKRSDTSLKILICHSHCNITLEKVLTVFQKLIINATLLPPCYKCADKFKVHIKI